MSTPLSTPIRQAKLGIASTKSLPLANEYKKLLAEQHNRLWLKHQQDLDLIDDIRGYVKARLSIERDYTSALAKLAQKHNNHIAKKFTLLAQCEPQHQNQPNQKQAQLEANNNGQLSEADLSDSRLQKRLANGGAEEPDKACTLYQVWAEHVTRLQADANNRAYQFEQLIMVVDKLKDIRSHKAGIGKRSLDTHMKRIHEDILVSMVDVEKARKLYYEDESQAKKARENEEKIKKKRSGLLTKFTDLQAKKEKTSAQREATDIQSTQARNDYIMALAAANAHLKHYYQRDLTDFMHLIDDGVLDHCKIFMATLSECDINSLKDSLSSAQYWSKMINLTGSQRTNSIFLDCSQSLCLRPKGTLNFEACNADPIQSISLEHNADYALQHEIDKWFTWFKKECRNLSQLMHQLEICQRAFAEGKKSIELNGQTTEDLEGKIVELKQQIRKSEAAKLKAQARLQVIRDGGMPIEEWSAVESEIRADMARMQDEMEARRAKEEDSGSICNQDSVDARHELAVKSQVRLQVSKDSDDSQCDAANSMQNLASVSRSTSDLVQKQQDAVAGYSTLTDPTLVWQDDYSSAWGSSSAANYNVVITNPKLDDNNNNQLRQVEDADTRYDLLAANKSHQSTAAPTSTMTVQSSSPLSAIVDTNQTSPSFYQGMVGEAYKSDFECDYNRNGRQMMRSTTSSADCPNSNQQNLAQSDPFGRPLDESQEFQSDVRVGFDESTDFGPDDFEQHNLTTGSEQVDVDASRLLNRRVVGLYAFDKTNEDDMAFNENDTMLVLEISDANWVRARNESSGEEGFVPTSYIQLLDDEPISESSAFAGQQLVGGHNVTSTDSDHNNYSWTTNQLNEPRAESGMYCRAVYSFEPEPNTFEDDGLPHLEVQKGELMLIIDHTQEDGWWLVEKLEGNARGYVPSMLLEETGNHVEAALEEEQGSELSSDELDGSVKEMPAFEPPSLPAPPPPPPPLNEESKPADLEVAKTGQECNSLAPTSFIIIEPTPELESRSLTAELEAGQDANPESTQNESSARQIVQCRSSETPAELSYSVINEEFVLEQPTRKPSLNQNPQEASWSSSPPLVEDANNSQCYAKTPDGNYEPLSEVDSLEMPAPPSVVIESCEDNRHDRSASYDDDDNNEDQDQSSSPDGSRNECTQQAPVYVHKEIKHTGNVDVSPILRLRAEEFSKQIIAEAIIMTPGSDVGPSTSSAYV